MVRKSIKASASKSQVDIAGFLAVQQNSDLHGKWILDQVITDVVNKSQNRDNNITKVELNGAVSNYYKNKADILLLHISNNYGVYKLQNERRINGKGGRVMCYFLLNLQMKTPSIRILPPRYRRQESLSSCRYYQLERHTCS